MVSRIEFSVDIFEFLSYHIAQPFYPFTRAEESDLCACGQKETVKHVLLDCRKWTEEKKVLKAAVRDRNRWGDMPYLLGGWSGRKDPTGKWIDGEASTWKPEWEIVRATIEFAMKTGRFSAE